MVRKFSKKNLFLLLFFIAFLLFAGTIGEATELKLRVKIQNAYIRLKPVTESMVISQIPIGAVLESKGKTGEWYRVELPPDRNGIVVSGYIHQSVVEVLEEIPKIPPVREEEYERIPPPVTRERIVQREMPVVTKTQGLTGVGLKIGIGSSNFYGDDVEEFEEYGFHFKSKMGLCFGGFLTYNINEMFAVQPEVLYVVKGAKAKETISVWGLSYKVKAKASITYLEIPVLARLNIPTQGNFKPHLFAGPCFALKLSDKYKIEIDGEEEEDEIEELKGSDFGLVIGAGADICLSFLGRGRIIVDIRYTMGLPTISDVEDEDVKNKVISFMLGYSF